MDLGVFRHGYEVLYVLQVCNRQETLRAWRKENTGKMDNAIHLLTGRIERIRLTEITFEDGHIRKVANPKRQLGSMNQQMESVVAWH